MPTTIRGLPNNIVSTLPAPTNISSSSNTTPVVITTGSAHGIAAGDGVLVAGHHNPLNGVWIASAVTSTTVTLLGSTAVGGGGATGTIRSLAVGADFSAPADNDAEDAASVNLAFEALADRSCFALFLLAQDSFRSGLNATLTNAATGQFIDTTYKAWKIPASLTGNATITVVAGASADDYVEIFRDPNGIDAHTVTLSCAGGFTYVLAGSTGGWIRLRWDGTNWYSIANGTGWTGTHALV